MKILIIEDEAPAVRKLIEYLSTVCPDDEILDDIDTVEDAIDWLKNNPAPDLIISDIQLADGISFDIFKEVKPNCPVIFTTAYDEYAIKAFKLNSVDYLLKPYTKKDFQRAIHKFLKNHGNKQDAYIKLDQVAQEIPIIKEKNTRYKERFLVSKGYSLIPIKTEDVAYFYTEEKTLSLVTKTGEHYFINGNLEDVESSVNPHLFFRVNRSFLIQADAINHIETIKLGKLVVELAPSTRQEVLVSRARASNFKAWLDR